MIDILIRISTSSRVGLSLELSEHRMLPSVPKRVKPELPCVPGRETARDSGIANEIQTEARHRRWKTSLAFPCTTALCSASVTPHLWRRGFRRALDHLRALIALPLLPLIRSDNGSIFAGDAMTNYASGKPCRLHCQPQRQISENRLATK